MIANVWIQVSVANSPNTVRMRPVVEAPTKWPCLGILATDAPLTPAAIAATGVVIPAIAGFHQVTSGACAPAPPIELVLVDRHTYRAPHFLMHSCCAVFFVVLLSECTVTHWPHASRVAHVTKHVVCVLAQKTLTPHRAMSCTLLDDTTHGHSFLTFSWISLPASRTTLRRSTASGAFTELPPFAGYEPKQLAEDRDYKHFTGWTWGFTCQTLVLPPSDHSIDLRLGWEHRDTTSGIGLGRWATSCSAGFTTVLTGTRSKCRTIGSLSLWTRRLDIQFISRFDKYRETCRIVFKPKSVEPRNVFR